METSILREIVNRSTPPDSYWSAVARDKTFTHPFRADLFATAVTRDAAVLDMGCGYGRLTGELHEAGWTCTVGADSAEGMITLAREQHPDLDFTLLAGRTLPWRRATFDAILLFSVLTCIPDRAQEQELLDEIRRVPIGTVLNSTRFSENLLSMIADTVRS